VPTVAEDGVPAFEAAGWQGYFVPARTPRDVVALIQRETARALSAPETNARIRAMGNEPVGSTPEVFEAKFRDDTARFITIVNEAGIPLQTVPARRRDDRLAIILDWARLATRHPSPVTG